MLGEDRIGFESLDKLPKPPRYSAFVLGQGGDIVGMVRLMAGSDSDALNQAQALLDGHAIELWDGMRYIHHFPPID